MKSPILIWSCGLVSITGLPIGLILAFQTGSHLAGLGGMITVVFIGLLACRKDIINEYKEKRNASRKK